MTSPLHSTILPVLTISPVVETDLMLRKSNMDEWEQSKSGTGLTSTLPAHIPGTLGLLWFKKENVIFLHQASLLYKINNQNF